MTAHPSATAQSGDKAPFFYGMLADGRFHSAEAQAGRPTALILGGRLAPGRLLPLLTAFARETETLARSGCGALALVSADPQWLGAALPAAGPSLLHCASEEVFAHAGLDGVNPLVLVLDRSLRIVARIEASSEIDDVETTVSAAVAQLLALPHEQPKTVSAPAPVLMVPNLIDQGFCAALIDHFENSAHVEGAMASADASGQAVNRVDTDKKHRRDCTLDPQSALHAAVLDVLDRRLLPEMKRAFQVDIAHIDRVLIARYDDTGGYFRRHRDNSAAQVAFRQFALSLNLNAEDYEGGELTFPEFNDHLHRPPTGAACVFSASLLHEAMPVTRGQRYVLLTFLHDDAAEARRRAEIISAAEVQAAA